MIEIIPAIDLIDGKCVRLSQGDFADKKIYYENPLDLGSQKSYSMALGGHMITVSNLSKSYGGQVLYQNGSFFIGAGEKVGLVGPNGAGLCSTSSSASSVTARRAASAKRSR